MQEVSVMIPQPPCLGRNLGLKVEPTYCHEKDLNFGVGDMIKK